MENKKAYIICKEISKNDGQVAIYRVTEVDDEVSKNLNYFSLRSRFNPELNYYLVLEENEELLKGLLKIQPITDDRIKEVAIHL